MIEISVIVPVYRAEAFLADCVESVRSQSFRDWELILVEDGSPDASGRLCDDFARADARIRVLHQENRGQAAARNQGVQMARGQWLFFLDSDDLLHPQALELLYRAAKESGCPIASCRMLEAALPPAEFFQGYALRYTPQPMTEENLQNCYRAERYPGWVACGKLLPREYLLAEPFCPGRVYEDNAVVCRWLLMAENIAEIPQNLYFYRGNPDSTTQKAFSEKRLDYLWALEQIATFYREQQYVTLADCFYDRWAEMTAAFYWKGAGNPAIRKKLRKDTWNAIVSRRLPLTVFRFETIVDALYPGVIRIYWPLKGLCSSLRQEGIFGLWKKLKNRLRK